MAFHYPASEKGVFRARDGTALYYEVRGRGAPLILCYGLTCQMQHWRHQMEYFASRYRVITLDYRGHHRSSAPKDAGHLTLTWCSRDIQDLLDFMEIESAICFGHSMGVPLVLQLASWEPDRVKGTVCICGTVDNPFKHMFYSDRLDAFYRVTSKFAQFFPETSERAWKALTKHNSLSYFMASKFGFNSELSDKSDVMGYLKGVHQSSLRTFQRLLDDYNEFSGRLDFKTVECPTLVVAGEKDFITPMHLSEKLVKELPKGQLEKISEGSHNAHMDFPGMVNRRIDQFLKKISY